MKRTLLLVFAGLFICSPAFASDYVDLDSATNTMRNRLEREFRFVIQANPNSAPTEIYIDVPRIRTNWNEFGTAQTLVSNTWTFQTEYPGYQMRINNDQWERLGYDTEYFNWSFRFEPLAEFDATVERSHALYGFTDDFQQIPGAYYTSYTASVPRDQAVETFCTTALANQSIPNTIKGYEGVKQRLHMWARINRPGDCNTCVSLVAGSRFMQIPSCTIVARTTPATYSYGSYGPYTSAGAGHLLAGNWSEAAAKFHLEDKGMGTNRFSPPSIILLGYFEDHNIYRTYIWADADLSASQIVTDRTAQVVSGSETWNVNKTRRVNDSLTAMLFTEKASSSFAPGINGPPDDEITGVPEDGAPAFGLVIYQNPISGSRHTLEFGVRGHGNHGTVSLFDIRGTPIPGMPDSTMDLDHNMVLLPPLPAGMYIARVTVENGPTFTQKITIVK